MHNALPPLTALRAFEATARLGAMSRAAEELSVTPGALSHQIRGLEDYLEVKLFERLPRSIQLTPAGAALYPGLQGGFQQIREAVAALRRLADPNVLVISTPPGLTAKWLAPRLYRFAETHPDVEVRVASSSKVADFLTDGVDLAIRNLPLGSPPPQGLVVEHLMNLQVLPVCAPSAIARFGSLTTPSDLARFPLIQDDMMIGTTRLPRWSEWFEAAGAPEAAHGGGLGFNSPDHALDAAVEGAGALLAQTILAHDDLKSGRLVAPFDLALPTGREFCLVYPDGSTKRPIVAAFREWVLREVAATCVSCAGGAKD